MIDSELPIPDADDATADPGPPVLLKRLGNAVEANLAKNKLETAGIPSFLGGEDAFAVPYPMRSREVELFVPQSMVATALEVLDALPADPSEVLGDPFVEDPGRTLSMRAFVAAVGGCMFFFPSGATSFIAAPVFVYAIYLSFRALAVSTECTAATLARCVIAALISAGGIFVACYVAFSLLH